MAIDKATAQDVAKRAGVSQSAVSRVFTPGASASVATSERVKHAAGELGYRPNVLARSLITGKSKIIGVVVASLENQFYSDTLEKLSNALQENGYRVLVFIAWNNVGSIDKLVDNMLSYQVESVVVASVSLSSKLAARFQRVVIPVVWFNRGQDDDHFSAMTSDNFSGGRQVAELLISLKHKKLGYVAGWDSASTQRDRENGFKTGIEPHAGVEFSRADGRFTRKGARLATLSLFSRDDRPTAVFVANDFMAFTVIDVLRYEPNLRVPEDVSVVGYDDVAMSNWPAYDLTTVRQPLNRMVAETINILINNIDEGILRSKRVALHSALVERSSTQIFRESMN